MYGNDLCCACNYGNLCYGTHAANRGRRAVPESRGSLIFPCVIDFTQFLQPPVYMGSTVGRSVSAADDAIRHCAVAGDVEVRFSDIAERVRCCKSASTAKGYLAVLGRLEQYCGCGSLLSGQVSADFVTGFGRFLAEEKLTAATVAMYKRTLRALLKDAFGQQCAGVIKAAFADVVSSNETDTRGITADELRRVAYADLGGSPWLMRVRDVFMMCVYGCGLPLGKLKQALAAEPGSGMMDDDVDAACGFARFPAAKWMQEGAAAFGRVHGTGIREYLAGLSESTYIKGLGAIGTVLQLKHPLTPKSAVDGWIAVAQSIGVRGAVIAAAVTGDTAYRKIMGEEFDDTTREVGVQAACRVAGAITDLTERWYAMRCFADSPEDVSARIKGGEVVEGKVETFIPVASQGGKNMAAGDRLMGKMLFFRCTSAAAVVLKNRLGRGVHVFSFHDSERTPAFINTDEMMAFMFLADVAGDTIRYFFPDETEAMPEFSANERVTVTNGNFTGHVGLIDKVGKDRLRVVVRIEAMNGAIVTAEIPAKFLRPAS